MHKLSQIFAALIIFAASAVPFANGQTASPKNSVVTGEVVSIDAGKVVLKTAEAQINVTLTDKTEYKRVPPENPVLKAAVAAALTDIGVGDKLLVTGIMSEDKTTLPAKAVYLMTKSDIAQRQTAERQRWATRGISGRVTAVNPDTKQITVEVRGIGAATSVVITPKDNVKVLRYAPNSVSYSEALASKVSDVAAGDMIRALGDRSQDGASFAAEEIVSGAFQTIAGTVKSVDPAANEIVITELQSKKDVTVALGSASVLKKFPEQMAQMLAARQAGPGAPGGQGAAPGGQRPVQAGQGQGRPGGGGGMGGGRGGIDEMLDRFPNITAADLQVGDMIAVSSSKTATLDRVTAIKLLAGVEPFIRVAQMQAASQSARGQSAPSLSIPGLDGFDMP